MDHRGKTVPIVEVDWFYDFDQQQQKCKMFVAYQNRVHIRVGLTIK